MQRENSSISKIIWAVDAFSEPALITQSAKVIKAVCAGRKTTVEPLYIVRPYQADLDTSEVAWEGSNEFRMVAKEKLDTLLQRLKVPGMLPTTCIATEGYSLRRAVEECIRYAVQNKADLIVLGTHARKGMPRLFLGSFAESAVFQSPLPVLLTNPRTHQMNRVRHILFPTDFSEKSLEVFKEVVHLANLWGAKIRVFHRMEYPDSQLYYPFIVPVVQVQSTKDLERARNSKAEELIKFGEAKGIEVSFFLAKGKSDVADAIAKAAKKLPSGIIAMASQTGPIASVLLGSVTRQVIRRASCPVFVMHPGHEASSRQAEDFSEGAIPLVA